MDLQLRIAEPMAEFIDLRPVPVIEMLAGAKDLDSRKPGGPDSFEPNRCEPIANEQVAGEDKIHLVRGLVAGGFAVEARFSTALQRAVSDDDRFNTSDAVGGLNVVSHRRQLRLDLR